MFKDEGVPIKLPESGIIPIKEKSEIEDALKQFETQSAVLQPSIQVAKVPTATDDMPGMVKLIIKLSRGTVKTQKTAEYVLLGIVILFMSISFYLFFGGGNKQPKLTPAMLEQLKQMPVNK